MCRKTWRSIQDKFYKSKTSPRFPYFDASNAWQMGHNSPEGIFLGQELLLDFAAWLDLTSSTDNTITVYQLPSKFQNTFWFFKTCWWLTGLLRLYDGSQPLGRHTRYFKTMPNILVDRALMRHISFLFGGISFEAWSIHMLCSRHNNQCKQSVPRFPLYMLCDLILTSYTINSLPSLFAYVLTRKPATKIQDHDFLLHWTPYAKIQALSWKLFFTQIVT